MMNENDFGSEKVLRAINHLYMMQVCICIAALKELRSAELTDKNIILRAIMRDMPDCGICADLTAEDYGVDFWADRAEYVNESTFNLYVTQAEENVLWNIEKKGQKPGRLAVPQQRITVRGDGMGTAPVIPLAYLTVLSAKLVAMAFPNEQTAAELSDYANTNMGDIKWDHDLFYTDGNFAPVWNAIQTFTMCPADNKFYFYTNEGVVARWDPATGKGEDLTPPGRFIDSQGDIMGVVFDPRDPNIVYFANQGQHCIYKHDIAAGTIELWAGRKNTAGYLDGPLAEAQFNYPCQMCVDPEGEAIYVTDRENHCIRKITLSNGYVSTFAGTPKSSGYVNGPADAAKFNKPVGLAITAEGNLYIGDSENYAIRRIAIE